MQSPLREGGGPGTNRRSQRGRSTPILPGPDFSRYLDQGWYLIPVKRGEKKPFLPRWEERATTDRTTVEGWASKGYNLGVACGPSGLVVIDEDERGAFERFASERGQQIPTTYTVNTSRGRHYYFTTTQHVSNKKGDLKAWDIDVRGAGGQVLIAGSVHPSGAIYEVSEDTDPAPIPTWLLQALGQAPEKPLELLEASPWDDIEQTLAQGRHDGVMRLASSLQAQGVNYTSAAGIMDSAVWPEIDQEQAGHEYTRQEFDDTIRDVYQRYAEPGSEGFEAEVAKEANRIRVREAAREQVRQENAPPRPPFDIGTLAEVLQRPADPPDRVEGLIPTEGNTLISAQRKTGKTTLSLNLARALLTGEDFLGSFPTREVQGRVALLNFEVSAQMAARWAQAVGLDQQRFVLVTLRGRRNPFAHPEDLKHLGADLRARQVESLIVDPFGRAFTGESQNDNSQVGAWLSTLEMFARSEVGAKDLVLVTHAGWDQERTRGATALEDWPDSIIRLRRGEDQVTRYLAAEGRDVAVEEDELIYDLVTHTLSMSGRGSRAQAAALKRTEETQLIFLNTLKDHPQGLSAGQLENETGLKKKEHRMIRDQMVASGELLKEYRGHASWFRIKEVSDDA